MDEFSTTTGGNDAGSFDDFEASLSSGSNTTTTIGVETTPVFFTIQFKTFFYLSSSSQFDTDFDQMLTTSGDPNG